MAVRRYEVSVRTRSSDRDYSWVGSPPHEWWLSGWGDSLLRRGPCVLQDIVEGDPQLLLTGIECSRRDGTGAQTRIRYDLLFTTEPGAVIGDDALLGLLALWWDQRQTPANTAWRLGQAIDDELAAVAAERGMTVDGLIESGDRAAMQESVARLPKEPVQLKRVTGRPPLSWIGAENAAAHDVLFGDAPFAYFPSTTKREAAAPDHLGVRNDVTLIVDGESGRGGIPRPKVPASAGAVPSLSVRHRRARLLLTTVAAFLIVAVSLAVVLSQG